MFDNVFKGARVLVTGHTGFKGSWLAWWLLEEGATVAGYALNVPTTPSHFETTGLRSHITHIEGDVRDRDRVARALDQVKPDVVFHLAAQPLVRRAYQDPVGTFEVNAGGTLNLLDCLRSRPWVRAAVFVTSDKCYRNVEWAWGYRETDTLGGDDPYSGSKACAELVAHFYYHSFFKRNDATPRFATARAGNVIGGGDWAPDRIVPDCVRAWSAGESVMLRLPHATRPWQHVLEPLSGYLSLASQLWTGRRPIAGGAFNFGPDASVVHPVERVVSEMAALWPGASWSTPDDEGITAEATLLKLSCDKALAELDWRPTLSFRETLHLTADWYRQYYSCHGARDGAMRDVTLSQLQHYCNRAAASEMSWSRS